MSRIANLVACDAQYYTITETDNKYKLSKAKAEQTELFKCQSLEPKAFNCESAKAENTEQPSAKTRVHTNTDRYITRTDPTCPK